MDCSEFNRLLDNYENLSSNELDEMNNHAQNCDNCKSDLEFYKSIMLTAASLPVLEPPADLIEKVNSRIDNLPKYQSGLDKAINNFRYNAKRYASLAACIAVGLVVGLNSGSIKTMLTPQQYDDQVMPIVDVADAGDASRDTDDAPVIDDAPVLPKPALTDTVTAEKESAAHETDRTDISKSIPGISQPMPITANTAAPAAVPTAVTASEPAPEVPAERTKMVQAPAASTQAPAKAKTSKYTIARDNYHIPTPTDTAAAVTTEAPNETVQTAPSERYQIAMGNYEISEEEKKAIKSKLIINESDIKEITECMNRAGIRGTSDGCEASAAAFSSFLAMLDARGIYYNYAEASSDGAMISFMILAN